MQNALRRVYLGLSVIAAALFSIVIAPVQQAQAATHALRFVTTISSGAQFSTASRVPLSVESYNTGTGLRVPITGETVTLLLRQIDGGAFVTIDADFATANLVNGLATFSGLVFSEIGVDYSLVASSPNSSNATSTGLFTVEQARARVIVDVPDTITTASFFPVTVRITRGTAVNAPADPFADNILVRLQINQTLNSVTTVVNSNFAEATLNNGEHTFVDRQITALTAAGAVNFLDPRTPNTTGIQSVGASSFTVEQAYAVMTSEPQTDKLVNQLFNVTLEVRRGSASGPVDPYANGNGMFIDLFRLVTGTPAMQANNFATAQTIDGVASFNNLQIGTQNTQYYFVTDDPSGAMTDTPGVPFDVYTPRTFTLSYSLQGTTTPLSAEAREQDIAVRLVRTETAPIFDDAVTPTVDAELIIPTLLPGTYTAWIKHPFGLARRMNNAVLPSTGNATIVMDQIRMGDANSDNVITIADFSLLAASFGRANGAVGYDFRADFDFDNAITIADFALLASNFGQVGSTAP